MFSMLTKIPTSQIELLHRMCSQTRGHSEGLDNSPTPGIIENTYHTEKTLSWDQEEMVTLLRRLLGEWIAQVMAHQITTLENIFTLKIETLLSQRTLALANTQMSHMYRIYERLQLENMTV